MEEDGLLSVPDQIQNWITSMKNLNKSFQFDQAEEDDLEDVEVWITDHVNNQALKKIIL
jgi:hypothetical protein